MSQDLRDMNRGSNDDKNSRLSVENDFLYNNKPMTPNQSASQNIGPNKITISNKVR